MIEQLATLVEAAGGVPAVAAAIGIRPDRLAAIVAKAEPSSFRVRRALAGHLGAERAQLFPEWAGHDAAVERGLAARKTFKQPSRSVLITQPRLRRDRGG